jgi:hypothetical protein
MSSGAIESAQFGTLWRTTPERVEAFVARQFEIAAHSSRDTAKADSVPPLNARLMS